MKNKCPTGPIENPYRASAIRSENTRSNNSASGQAPVDFKRIFSKHIQLCGVAMIILAMALLNAGSVVQVASIAAASEIHSFWSGVLVVTGAVIGALGLFLAFSAPRSNRRLHRRTDYWR